jgi:hypothetical protein
MSRSTIPKLNSPVTLVSTDLILFLHQIPKKKIHSDKAKITGWEQ